MHPENPHRNGYDFTQLIQVSAELKSFVVKSKRGDDTIDFDDPKAVRALNAALLKTHHGVKFWEIPESFLCPPVPGRCDHLLHVARLFQNPRNLRVLDLGVGANCIYPLLGVSLFNWSFVATDISTDALIAAQLIVDKNDLQRSIELRLQPNPSQKLSGVVSEKESFDLVICNPPFHTSAEEAQAGTQRKRTNLGLQGKAKLNFGGVSNELWCQGGEYAFIEKLIDESVRFRNQVKWFSSLVSKDDHTPGLIKYLERKGPKAIKLLEMQQGQKKSRLLAWSFS
jgi:23S rRNA (adenine1618-N6)-methyltransferase